MLARLLRALAVAAALLALPAVAQGAPAPFTRLPAEFQRGVVYVQVSLNGAAAVWMVFDPNAADSALYGAGAVRLTVRAGDIAGPVAFHAAPAAAAACASDGRPVAGRLGTDWLGDRVAVIRSREHQLWLSEPVAPPPAPIERPVFAASLTR